MTDHTTDRTELLNYVDRFAQILVDSGMPRMSARVFAYILADDATSYTAAELAEGLGVSLAAISGSARELVTMGVVTRGRRPATRADVYEIDDADIWGRMMLDRSPLLDRYRDLAEEGVRVLPEGPGRDRLQQTAEYMEFIKVEFEGVRARWKAHLRQQDG